MSINKVFGSAWENMPIVVSIDDDLKLLCHYWLSFGLSGFRCIPCRTAGEVLCFLDTLPVALVTIDFHMGNTNGVQVARSIRERGFGHPLLLLSGDIQSVNSEDLRLFDSYHDKGQRVDHLILKMAQLAGTWPNQSMHS